VVRALVRLIRIRTTHPAFDGDFSVHDSAPGELALGWRAPNAHAELRITFADASFRLHLRSGPSREDITDALLTYDRDHG
jgi:sucrose phosphorylase